MGKFGTWLEENMMYGMTPKTLAKTPGLWPTYFCIGGGIVLCTWFSLRTFLTNPDGIDPITGKGNWEKYRDKDFKLLNYSGLFIPSSAPNYKQPGDPDDDSYAQTNIGTVHLQKGYKPHH